MVFNYLSRIGIDFQPWSPNWSQAPHLDTLKTFPIEYKTMEEKVADHVSRMLSVYHNKLQAWDPRLCVALEFGKRSVNKLLIAKVDGLDVKVVINYGHHMMRCQFYVSRTQEESLLKFGLIALGSLWDPIEILHNSKHGNIINDQKSRPSPLLNKSSCSKGTTYQVLITQIEAKGWLKRKLMKASHWFNIKYAYLQFDEMGLLLKG
jgi:hypothetical protein